MEVFLTVIAGVCVYILSELAKELILEPLQEYRQIKAKASRILIYYANCYMNPVKFGKDNVFPDDYYETQNELRSLAAEVGGFIETLYWVNCIGIPSTQKLARASSSLIGLSNSLHGAYDCNVDFSQYEQNERMCDELRKALDLHKIDT